MEKVYRINQYSSNNILKYLHSTINIHYITQFNLASCFEIINRLVIFKWHIELDRFKHVSLTNKLIWIPQQLTQLTTNDFTRNNQWTLRSVTDDRVKGDTWPIMSRDL